MEGLCVTQLNSEEPFVAAVTLSARQPKLADGGQGASTGAVDRDAMAVAAKAVLSQHNVGFNTVEIVQSRAPRDQEKCGASVLPAALENTRREEGNRIREGGYSSHDLRANRSQGPRSGDAHRHHPQDRVEVAHAHDGVSRAASDSEDMV